MESAIILTLYPMSLKYSDRVIPGEGGGKDGESGKDVERFLTLEAMKPISTVYNWSQFSSSTLPYM